MGHSRLYARLPRTLDFPTDIRRLHIQFVSADTFEILPILNKNLAGSAYDRETPYLKEILQMWRLNQLPEMATEIDRVAFFLRRISGSYFINCGSYLAKWPLYSFYQFHSGPMQFSLIILSTPKEHSKRNLTRCPFHSNLKIILLSTNIISLIKLVCGILSGIPSSQTSSLP